MALTHGCGAPTARNVVQGIDGDTVITGAPVDREFVGAHHNGLKKWLARGGFYLPRIAPILLQDHEEDGIVRDL